MTQHRDKLLVDEATSRRLSRIPQKDTKPERIVRGVVRALGHHYRKNVSNLPGSPDLANVSKGWAIFVHGCYWHHHEECSRATIPKRNREFWVAKFERNRQRDARKVEQLLDRSLRVAVVWECETKDLDALAHRLSSFLDSEEPDS